MFGTWNSKRNGNSWDLIWNSRIQEQKGHELQGIPEENSLPLMNA
jgi:hypothetical protein